MSGPRLLQFLDLTLIGVGSSLGIGLFVLFGELIKNVAGPAVVVSVFLAGVTAILTGLCFTELGIRLLKIDSIYMYCYTCNGENVAFIVGWTLLLSYVAGVASAIKGIITFIDAFINNRISNFLTETTPIQFEYGSPHFDYCALILVFVPMVALMVGMKDSFLIKKTFTVCSTVLVLCIIIAGFFKVDTKNWQWNGTSEGGTQKSFAPFGFLGVVKGAALSYYGFIGFDRICLSGNEIRKPRANLPLSILVSLFIALLAYEGTVVILTLMHSYDQLISNAALPFAFEGTVFKWIIAGGAFFGFQTCLFGVIFPLPKVIHFMANDGLLFYFLGGGQGRNRSPALAIVAGFFLAAILAGFFTFQQLASLTVISTLFVCTIMAADVIILRYFVEKEESGRRIEDLVNYSIQEENFTIKETLQSSFHRKTDIPTKLTEKVITADLILFCACSIGLSVALICFSELLFKLDVQVLLPAIIFLIILILSLISMACQPKSLKYLPFRVPLMPFTPCLNIFLNIFLMISFESSTWVLFSVWMGLGISLYVIWFCLKYRRGQTGKDSLYEINRTNLVKLNESIWKIRLEKKSFYEGAINPVFSDELEDVSDDVKTINENGVIIRNEEKVSVQMKHAEIIETDVMALTEKTKPLKNEANVDIVDVNSADRSDKTETSEFQAGLTEERTHLECVAEVHMEEIFSQENVALEIVDNTYKFLKEINEDLPSDEIPEQNSVSLNSASSESNVSTLEMDNKVYVSEGRNVPFPPPLPERMVKQGNQCQFPEINESDSQSFDKRLAKGIQSLKKTKNENLHKEINENHSKTLEEDQNASEGSNESRNSEENKINDDSEVSLTENEKNQITKSNTLLPNKEKNFENSKEVEQNEIHNNHVNNISNEKEIKPKHDDYKKIKNFKERLNELLKNQMNTDSPFGRESLISKSDGKKDENPENNEKTRNNNLYKSIKTLKKSEIKDKLELLLAKGPPKRVSLKNSFNAGVMDTNRENDINKLENDPTNLSSSNHVTNEIASKREVDEVISTLSQSLTESTTAKNEGQTSF